MMLNGRGGRPDTAGAVKLFEKAAASGHSGAMFALGALSDGEHGLPRNRNAAQRWFRKAAELGNGHAQLMLSRYLAAGLAGERNLSEARRWLEQAADHGLVEAQQELITLDDEHSQRA